jgi:hypothetical protein
MSTLDKKLDDFQRNGPFTFDRVWQLVKMCARSRDTDFCDVLEECLSKFPPNELSKIFNLEQILTPEQQELFYKGCSTVEFRNYYGNFTDQQLEVIAQTKLVDFEQQLDLSAMEYKDKLEILKINNRQTLKEVTERKKRNKSPHKK